MKEIKRKIREMNLIRKLPINTATDVAENVGKSAPVVRQVLTGHYYNEIVVREAISIARKHFNEIEALERMLDNMPITTDTNALLAS